MQKDKTKGRRVIIYRPMTYLPLVWKLRADTEEEIYVHLETQPLLAEEEKRCRNSSGTNDILFFDKMILLKLKMRYKNGFQSK